MKNVEAEIVRWMQAYPMRAFTAASLARLCVVSKPTAYRAIRRLKLRRAVSARLERVGARGPKSRVWSLKIEKN